MLFARFGSPAKFDLAGVPRVEEMWSARNEQIAHGLRFSLDLDSRPATFAAVIEAWQSDAGFRTFFNSLLAEAPFDAFRWETPSVTISTLTRPFEFVSLDAPGLTRSSEPDAYAEYFRDAESSVVTFPNLGGDAILVVPCPIAGPGAYAHIAAFVRAAPEEQRNVFWQAVGQAMTRRVSEHPVWLSTAGAGVSWLHVRLDNRPKYYGFQPYRRGA